MSTMSIRHVDPMSSGARPASALASVRRPSRIGRHQPLRRLIIAEDLFKDVLIRERKRADRSNESMVLVLVALKDRAGDDSPAIWAPVVEALAAVARETDALGWFEWRAVMGIILPGACAVDGNPPGAH